MLVLALQCAAVVWDGVFDKAVLQSLHRAGLGLVLSGWTGSVWDRHSRAAANPLEEAVCSLLHGCEDDSQYVEYWWREHYADISVHRDVDEALCESLGLHCCPRFGHVLYVDVEPALRAPTLLWHEDAADAAESDLDRGGAPRQLKSLTCVPAVASRLLRFDGATLHSVAQPPAMSAGAAGGGSSTPLQRSVLLFNSWQQAPVLPDYEEPPPRASTVPLPSQPCACLPPKQWTAHGLAAGQPMGGDGDGETFVDLCPTLLGSEERRGCEAPVLRAAARAEELERALLSASQAYSLSLAVVGGGGPSNRRSRS